MRSLDMPAVFAAVSLKPDALDSVSLQARDRQLVLVASTENGPVPIILDARDGEGEDLDAPAVPGFLLDLARVGLAALRCAYITPDAPVIEPIAAEISRMRKAGLAMPRDPGALPEGVDHGR